MISDNTILYIEQTGYALMCYVITSSHYIGAGNNCCNYFSIYSCYGTRIYEKIIWKFVENICLTVYNWDLVDRVNFLKDSLIIIITITYKTFKSNVLLSFIILFTRSILLSLSRFCIFEKS